MGLDFVRNYGGSRLVGGSPLPDPFYGSQNGEEDEQEIELDIERELDNWTSIPFSELDIWRPRQWALSPIRFVDGKDVGQIIAWIRSPEGYPIPIRLSQIGGVAMRIVDGTVRREFFQIEKVVSMPVDFFPWDEVESFGVALQQEGFRLLPATATKQEFLLNYEKMRRVTENRSREEMFVLEEAAIAQDADIPTVVDGRLEPHAGGFDRDTCPVFGVIKRHYRSYLHPAGQLVLYGLKAGERTPVFALRPRQRLATLSWYVKINDEPGDTPDSGYVRIETAYDWFIKQGLSWDFADLLSRVVFEYRCRQKSYSRAAVSLHPIVRAEESLGALFRPESSIYQSFYRLTQI